MDDLTVKHVHDGRINPLFVNSTFPYLTKRNANCEIYETSSQKRRKVVVYDEYVLNGNVNCDSLIKTFVAVSNRSSDEIDLYPVTTVNLNGFAPKNRNNYTEQKVVNNTQLINKTFGSKKSIRGTERVEKMKIDINSVRDNLQDAVTVTENDLTMKSMEDSVISQITPPINREATDTSEVYNVNDLISHEEFLELLPVAHNLLTSTHETMSTVYNCNSTYAKEQIAKLLTKVKNNGNSNDSVARIVSIWIYIDGVVKYLTSDLRTIRSNKFVCCAASAYVNEQILAKFSLKSGGSRMRPNTMRDKCICYIIVLSALASSKYVVDLEELVPALKVTVDKLTSLTRACMLQKVQRSVSTLCGLLLPLPKISSYIVKRKSYGKKK